VSYQDPRPETKIGKLRQAIYGLLQEHQRAGAIPTSLRFLYYELIARKIISKEKTGARRTDQDMIEAATDLREWGVIPWGWIIDETRNLDDFSGWPTVLGGVEACVETVALDPWKGNVPLILTESRSLAGVLRAICGDYRVKIASTNGQANGFLRTKLEGHVRSGTTVLYLGDWDFSGHHIEDNTRAILEDVAGGSLDWTRLAITEEQIEEHNLVVIDKYDKRTKSEHPAVETEALSQTVLIGLVRDTLHRLLPEPLDDVLERERAEQERILRHLQQLRRRR
jgi:hypothetical protein